MNGNCDISFCDYYEEKDGYQKEYKSRYEGNCVLSRKEFVDGIVSGMIQGFLCNKLLRKQILYDQNGEIILLPETISICEDFLYLIQIVWNAEQFSHAAFSLYYYCQRNDSAYHSPYNRRKLTEILAYDKVHEILSSKMPEALPLLEKKYLNMALKLQDLFVHSKQRNEEEREFIQSAIQKYEVAVMKNPEVSSAEKIYYKLYKWFPKKIRMIKNVKHWMELRRMEKKYEI